MDMKTITALIVGTILRGLMWVGSYLAGQLGVDAPPDSTWEPVAAWLTAIVLALGAMAWSWIKNQRLLQTPPPDPYDADS